VSFTPQEWSRFVADHFPPGDALDTDFGSYLSLHLRGLAHELSRFDALLDQVGAELDPREASSLLTDFERELDLPRCGFQPETSALRRAMVVALLTRSRDLSAQTLIDGAAVLGYGITIKEYFPETVPADLPISNRFRYDVTLSTELEVVPFRTGQSTTGDPLGKVEQADLECLLDELQPAYMSRVLL
jgi:uncharacterized protein YmfQ (DUF2313 family)